MRLPPSRRAGQIPPSTLRRLFDGRRPTSINLGLGEPAEPVTAELFDRGLARWRGTPGGYTLNAGILDLRERIAAYRGLPHAPSGANAVVTAGSTGGLFASLLAATDPGDEVLILEPAYPNYASTAEMLGLAVRRVPRDAELGFALDADRIATALTPRSRAVIVNSPSNPTGRVDSRAELAALVAVTEAAGLWLISDEVYRDIHFTPEPPASLGELTDRAIVIGGLSKSCAMTGFRLGYVLADHRIAPAVAAAHRLNVICAPSLSQQLALEAFAAPDRWLHHYLARHRQRRAALLAAIDDQLGLAYVRPEGGLFLFVDVGVAGMPSMELAERLLEEADVVTIPGSAFGAGGEGYLRLAFTVPESEIAEGVGRIAAFLAFHG